MVSIICRAGIKVCHRNWTHLKVYSFIQRYLEYTAGSVGYKYTCACELLLFWGISYVLQLSNFIFMCASACFKETVEYMISSVSCTIGLDMYLTC